MRIGHPLDITIREPARKALAAVRSESEYFHRAGARELRYGCSQRSPDPFPVLNRAGIKGHPHQFRDTFSARLLENGEDIRTVQQLLGHQSL